MRNNFFHLLERLKHLSFWSYHSLIVLTAIISLLIALPAILYYQSSQRNLNFLQNQKDSLTQKLASVSAQLKDLENQDQIKINKSLQEEISNIQKTYKEALSSYENLLDFNGDSKKKTEFSKLLAQSLKLLSDRSYASASAALADLDKKLKDETVRVASSFKVPENIKESNSPPSSGYSRQKVKIDNGEFMVDIISADLNSTRVIVDTASDSDCKDNCPTFSLADYVSRSGAFAGINGSFFCPAEYPSCAGKTNSFDTLLMNKNKKYFNSDNNVYSTVPAVIFSGSSARFVTKTLEWGRDNSVDAVLANYPLYVLGGQVMFSGSGDPKIDSKGSRTFVATNGSTVYIGIVYNASAQEAANVLKEMGMQNALGLDQGGSTALWYGGYKVGPGRNIPNALLLVRK